MSFDSSEYDNTDSHNSDDDTLPRPNTRSSVNSTTLNVGASTIPTSSVSESFLDEGGAGGNTKGYGTKKKYGNKNQNT